VSPARTGPKPIRNGGGRPKIDWGAARSYYARHPEVGYLDVGRKFSVSKTAVCKHANAEGWDDYRATIQAAVDERRRDTDIRSLEERQADTIRVAERLREIALDPDAEIDAITAVRRLPLYAKLEELFAGKATQITEVQVRVCLEQVVSGYDALFAQVLAEELANGKRASILRKVRERVPPMLELAAAIEAPA
jgi:hypothetical protein